MKWREAHMIGRQAEGIIRCTYARIYDKSGHTLFSLQRVDAEEKPIYTGNRRTGDVYMVGWDKADNAVFQWREDIAGQTDIADINYDLPLVVTSALSDNKIVPAAFTDKAREIIIKSLQNMRKVNRVDIYRVWDVTADNEHKAGDREKVAQQYSMQIPEKYLQRKATFHYEWETVNVIRPSYQKLINILESGDVVYIRPAAFDWQPIDIKATDLDAQIAAAKQRLETAKATVIAAGIATLL